MRGKRFEDFSPGTSFRTYGRTVTEADFINFIGLAGLRLPMFIDEEYAKTKTPFGGRIAPGFLTCAITAGMLESVLGENTLAGLGMDTFRFKRPVRPGDTLCCEIGVLESRETSKAAQYILKLQVRVLNQRDELVLEYTSTVLMKR